jgi:C-terminal peptidase prc
LLAVLLLMSMGLLPVSAAEPDGEVEERKPIPAEVKKTAADYADTIIEAIHILSKDHVKKVSQAELAGWAIDGLYKRMGERIPPEILKRLSALRDPKEADLRPLLIEARQPLGKGAKLSEFRDMDMSLAGIFERLEPGTKLQPLRESRGFCVLYISRIGIGAEVCKDEDSGLLRVVTPIKDGSAYKAGIRAGDIIMRITQEKDEKHDMRPWSVSTKGLTIEQAKERLLGPIDSKIKLTVYREDPSKPRDVVVVRKFARKETVFGVRRKPDDSWDYLLDRRARIAYIRITEFRVQTLGELKDALASLRRRQIKGLILDLRGNPGGLIPGSLDCAALFLDKVLLVTVRLGNGERERDMIETRGRFRRTPLVCLLDGGTARACELLAACLQDHHRAVIVGERSRGDVDIRVRKPLPHGDLQFMSAAFYRPNGKPLSKVMTSGKDEDDWGVRPDKGFVVKLAPEERKELVEHLRRLEIIAPFNPLMGPNKPAFRDRQLEKALEHLQKPVRKANS